MAATTTYLVTGDIGGTNSRMSLYQLCDSCKTDEPVFSKTFRNATSIPEASLSHDDAFIRFVLKPFLDDCWSQAGSKLEPISNQVTLVGCIASAGVVSNNQVRLTNLGNLLICGNLIEKDRSSPYMARWVRCTIINDFVAQGYGCLTLNESEVVQLHGPTQTPLSALTGPKVCVGAGTGLGECYLTQSVHQSHSSSSAVDPYSCFPSEGGHVEFAPRNALEVELFQYLSNKFSSRNRISVERVVSGKGLANVYEFLAQKYPERVAPAVHQDFLQAGDEQGRVVAEHAQQDPASLCRQALNLLLATYGCEVGSAALKWIPTGGLFVTGGLTPKNLNLIQGADSEFLQSYRHKGRVAPLLERIPLFAVKGQDLGVRGVHKAALMLAQDRSSGGNTSATAKSSSFSLDKQHTWALLLGATAGAALAALAMGGGTTKRSVS